MTDGEPSLALRGDLTVATIDPRLADLLGRLPAELEGQRLADLLHADDGRLAGPLLRGRPPVPSCTRWRWRTAAGDLRTLTVWWTATADGWTGVLGGSGKLLTMIDGRRPGPAGTAASARDKAERLARVATVEHDLATGTTTWSPLMYELHGLEPSRPPPVSLEEYLRLLHPDDADVWVRALHHTLSTGEVVKLQARAARPGGGYRTLEVALCCELRTDGSPGLVSGTMQDVTDEVEARGQLVRERERALADTRAKSDFLARVTHELRTPVAGVIGMIDLALDDADPAERGTHLSSARASARHLLELIDDLLDASREEAWRFNIVEIRFSLEDVMAQALAMVAPRAHAKGLDLRGEVAPGLSLHRRGDPLRLRQILVNLMSNAVKFTEHGAVVARFAAAGPGEVELTVVDSGIGIGPELQATVFEPYVRGATGEGVGLGLAITRELVQALGGRISFTSTPQVGTRFAVVLPLPEQAGEPAAEPRSPGGGGGERGDSRGKPARALRVLLVEDHPVNAAFLEIILSRAGHQVTAVGTGRGAIDAAARGDLDVALMDMGLPDLDGAAAVRAIRAAERAAGHGRLPILGLSAHRDGALLGAAAGMDGYLTKPVDAETLLAQLERVTADGWRPPIDHATRLARVGGRRELAATIAQTFLGHAAGLLEPIDAAIDGRSEEGVRRAAHGLRAALLMVGAVAAGDLAAELERGTIEQARARRDALAFEVARATAELALSA